MATAPDVYSAEPTHPVLASSLLTQPKLRTTDTTRSAHESTDINDWNLKDDWDAGIQSSAGTFRCGAVIGFSRLRNQSKENDEYIAQSTVGQPLPKEDAIERLSSVQLLPIHNFPNAAQAIGKVSDSLQELQTQRTNNHSVVLIVVSLDTLSEGIIRASNPVKGTALLAATLRNLTRLSRAYASFLSVMLVNTNGLGPPNFESDQQSEKQKAPVEDDTRFSRDGGIHSIFQIPGPSLLFNLLMKTLDQGIDTHILLSDVKSAKVAEVIKDRVGPGLGKWGIWTSK
ncbi:uncharacterized protein N7498_003676 [Penicillium cinerascens]|uniref:Uncharacterized protein n=1 Tax=Penicillium cinerascens TaxID=70096 RepID=A0A9W9T846_9EURO|nr:uncharacterized protein N7498_003676 [Penicillium cinerascens]KAJ5212030.1 hypothetical protein N7498_003676 [Penicillium cinerascens]